MMRQYPSYDAAVADLHTKGKFTFRGSEAEEDIYTLDIQGVRYILKISKEGKVRMLYEISPWRGD